MRATRAKEEEPKLAIVVMRTTLTLLCDRLRIQKFMSSSQLWVYAYTDHQQQEQSNHNQEHLCETFSAEGGEERRLVGHSKAIDEIMYCYLPYRTKSQ